MVLGCPLNACGSSTIVCPWKVLRSVANERVSCSSLFSASHVFQSSLGSAGSPCRCCVVRLTFDLLLGIVFVLLSLDCCFRPWRHDVDGGWLMIPVMCPIVVALSRIFCTLRCSRFVPHFWSNVRMQMSYSVSLCACRRLE